MILPYWGRIRRQAASYPVRLESSQAFVSKPSPNDKVINSKLSFFTYFLRQVWLWLFTRNIGGLLATFIMFWFFGYPRGGLRHFLWDLLISLECAILTTSPRWFIWRPDNTLLSPRLIVSHPINFHLHNLEQVALLHRLPPTTWFVLFLLKFFAWLFGGQLALLGSWLTFQPIGVNSLLLELFYFRGFGFPFFLFRLDIS